ncbi:ABC-2 type transporter domain-containing protein [Phthorimaea operculella]|nr:ABC-2 type transporter domain-containing protein [Phthorimaea operculella]
MAFMGRPPYQQEWDPYTVWRHVPGEWNPADCASRGCRAPDLVSHPLWWGPQWLTESPQEWPFNECRAPLGPPDRGLRVNVGQLVPKPNPAFLLERYSSLDKLLGVTGWIKRFVNNCRKHQAERNFTPVLSPAERNAALCSLVRVVQAEHFEEEVRLLRDGRGKLKGGIVRLNPFLDEQGFVVSCICDTERTATYLALGSFLPMIMLCGIIWPVEGMHFLLQWISYVLPLTKSTESLRSMLQRGWGIAVPTVYSGFVSTAIWILVYLTTSILLIKFKKG